MTRAIQITGNPFPALPVSAVRLFGALLFDKLVGHGSQVIGHGNKVIDAEIEAHGGVLVLHVNAGVRHAVGVGEGANGNFAVGRYLDSVHGRTIAAFAIRTTTDAASQVSRRQQGPQAC